MGGGGYQTGAPRGEWANPAYTPSYGGPAPKRRIWPWVVGIIGVLLIGFIGFGVLGVYWIYKRASTTTITTTEEKPKKTFEGTKFVNSKSNLSSKLRDHYADFSFTYPHGWEVDKTAGKIGSDNFVKVEHAEDDFTIENFAVGWYTGSGTYKGDEDQYPKMAEQLSSQFSTNFPEYRKVSEGKTTVGSFTGYEFRFSSTRRNAPSKGTVKFWGRVVFIPSGKSTQKNGVTMVMIASSLSDEVRSLSDVGEKGDLAKILESFELGPPSSTSESDEPPPAEKTDKDSSSTTSASNDAVYDELMALEKEWTEANIKADRVALNRILAAEYTGTYADGTVQNKTQYIATIKPDATNPTWKLEDTKLTMKGETGIITGILKWTVRGRTTTYRFTDTFVKKDGTWQAIGSQSTVVK
jgi:hypothetical protein